jgi:hypothetical protein
MKQRKFYAAMVLLAASMPVWAGPGEAECKVTTAIDSPAATFVKLPIIIANPTSVFAFAVSSYRNALCPKPELITREQAQDMVDAAVAQQFERLSKAQQLAVVAGNGEQ